MKIDQLPTGARFQWKGRNYTKVGPMTAAAESGGVDFIPKHATLQPIPGEAPPAAPTEHTAAPLDAAGSKPPSRPTTAPRCAWPTKPGG